MKRNALKLIAALASLSAPALGTQAPARADPPRPYHVSASLREVDNLPLFQKTFKLSPEIKSRLARQMVAAAPTNALQLFHIYENNDYLNIPSFITTDSVLQLYHVFYDFSMRKVESDALSPVLERLTRGMLADSIATWNAATDAGVKEAALKNIAYFGVADRCLGLADPIPDQALPMVRVEIGLLDKHAGFAQGSIFPYKFDYSQFVPRGHYTRTQTLRQFFRAMTWYGLVPFALSYSDANGAVRADTQIRQSLLWVYSLYHAGLDGDWETIYEPTSFYAGFADDLTPAEWKGAMDQVYGAGAGSDAFADAAKLSQFIAACDKLRLPRIGPKFGRLEGVPAGTPSMIEPPLVATKQLRFMGQRYIPDSEILERLAQPGTRVFPSGLDVMAVLGSARAREILDGNPAVYGSNAPFYKPERAKLSAEFAALPAGIWNSNLYWSWLDVLKTLNAPASAASPSFMHSQGWTDKSLNTALASWAELRHDTILYGKQSVVECGGPPNEVPFVKGYVEPNLAFWERLQALNRQSRDGLASRKLLSDDLAQRFNDFGDLLDMLKRIAQKEGNGTRLAEDEYLELRFIGGQMEHITLSVMDSETTDWASVSETDKDMSVVADVATGDGKALEEAVGHANEIFVIVPVEGKLELARGASFSYYEFKQPIANRLTDEAWQTMLKAGKAPAAPAWTNSFLVPAPPKSMMIDQVEPYDTGC